MMINFNGARFLPLAIDSVLRQSYRDFELVIQDDCSTDASWEICEYFAEADNRVKPSRNRENLGTPGNRAAALSSTQGKLVCHVDSDDMLYPWSLEVMSHYFSKDKDLSFAYSDCSLIDEEGNVAEYRRNNDFSSNLSNFGWRHFGMYRRDHALNVGGFNKELARPCEDGDLVMRLMESGEKHSEYPMFCISIGFTVHTKAHWPVIAQIALAKRHATTTGFGENTLKRDLHNSIQSTESSGPRFRRYKKRDADGMNELSLR